MTVPTREPQSFTAGDTVKWTKSLPDYPASQGWTLTYYAIEKNHKFSVVATASGNDFAITIPATTSDDFVVGHYFWEAQVTKAGERFTIERGTFDVLTNIAAQNNWDGRSHARKTLDAIEAVIEGRASTDQQEYSIGNRSLKRTPIADLIVLADKYRAMVNAEENAEAIAQGRGAKNRILVRF